MQVGLQKTRLRFAAPMDKRYPNSEKPQKRCVYLGAQGVGHYVALVRAQIAWAQLTTLMVRMPYACMGDYSIIRQTPPAQRISQEQSEAPPPSNTGGRETSVPGIKAQHGPRVKAQHGWERYGNWSQHRWPRNVCS